MYMHITVYTIFQCNYFVLYIAIVYLCHHHHHIIAITSIFHGGLANVACFMHHLRYFWGMRTIFQYFWSFSTSILSLLFRFVEAFIFRRLIRNQTVTLHLPEEYLSFYTERCTNANAFISHALRLGCRKCCNYVQHLWHFWGICYMTTAEVENEVGATYWCDTYYGLAFRSLNSTLYIFM